MRSLRTMIVLLVSAVILAACSILPPSNALARNDARVIPESDDEMLAAAAQAQSTLDVFTMALDEPDPALEFMIKARFPILGSDRHYEHLWVEQITYDGDIFTGVIADVPIYIQRISYLDIVRVAREDITDWMIIEDGRVNGGYTLRVLRSRMSPQERKQFDSENGLIFAEPES